MPLSTSLVAAWELNEVSGNATDSKGSNTLTDNNTVTSGTGPIYALARDFELDNAEYFSIADNTDISLSGDISCTFEAWIKFGVNQIGSNDAALFRERMLSSATIFSTTTTSSTLLRDGLERLVAHCHLGADFQLGRGIR